MTLWRDGEQEDPAGYLADEALKRRAEAYDRRAAAEARYLEIAAADPVMQAFRQALDDLVKRQLDTERTIIERACEEALTGGVAGVMVTHYHHERGGLTAGVSLAVPYGQIYVQHLHEPLPEESP